MIAPAGGNDNDVHSAIHESLVIGGFERFGVAVFGNAGGGFVHAILVNVAKRGNYDLVVDENVGHKSVSALAESYETYFEFVFHFIYPFLI